MFGGVKDFCPSSPEKFLGHFFCKYFLMKTFFWDDL